MTKQAVKIVAVNYKPQTRKIVAVKTSKQNVFSVDQIRKFIDAGIAIVVVYRGKVSAVTKRDETGIQSIRDDTKENNLDNLPEFDL
jgi:Protein of unknown function (DUF3892)